MAIQIYGYSDLQVVSRPFNQFLSPSVSSCWAKTDPADITGPANVTRPGISLAIRPISHQAH
jgi:hypothetical protein